jgi:sugar phosphate isomerase/epimerase
MNWDAIVPAMRSAGLDLMVLEHDNPSDAARFATRSFTTASAF